MVSNSPLTTALPRTFINLWRNKKALLSHIQVTNTSRVINTNSHTISSNDIFKVKLKISSKTMLYCQVLVPFNNVLFELKWLIRLSTSTHSISNWISAINIGRSRTTLKLTYVNKTKIILTDTALELWHVCVLFILYQSWKNSLKTFVDYNLTKSKFFPIWKVLFFVLLRAVACTSYRALFVYQVFIGWEYMKVIYLNCG